MTPEVRDRRAGDLPALLALLRRTHEQEGYPVRAAAVSADWLASPAELAGAVATEGARVLGHVALHPADRPGDPDAPARAYYRRRGWREVGSAVQQWGHRTVDAVCMVLPAS